MAQALHKRSRPGTVTTILFVAWRWSLMTSKSRQSDRRGAARFEIIGRRGASLVLTELLRVVNLSRGGLLVETARPLNDDATYAVQIESNALVSSVQARVVRVSRAAEEIYHVALEFVTVEPTASTTIDQMLQAGGSSRA